ncbi:MAG: glycosyltransferase [Armatimonadota bacterium]|nr:glycosyltransferase [Armatimonadota bacterium]
MRTRVLILVKGLGVGGAERLLERAIPYLDRTRFDYRIAYLLPWKDALVPAFQAAGIPVHCLGYARAWDAGVLWRLVALLMREPVELVHAHLPVAGVLARLARTRARVRGIVYTEHNTPARYGRLTRRFNAATYRLNDVVIAVSAQVEAQVRPYVRNGRPRLVTIPNVVDAAVIGASTRSRGDLCREFGFPEDARLVVNVANLVPKKGHSYLLAAARRVTEQDPRARFLVIGTGPLAGQLADDARRAGLDGRLVFAGFRPDATALVSAADVFVLSSTHEGLPIALLEAMTLGRAVVATRVGGVPGVVTHGETGLLVEPGDPDALARETLALLGDDARRQLLGRQARQRALEQGGMAEMVKAVERVYEELVAP